MALEGVRGQRQAPAALHPRERPGTHCTGGWFGPRAGLDRCGKSRLTWIRSPDRPARSQSLYRLSYPAHGFRNDFLKYESLGIYVSFKRYCLHRGDFIFSFALKLLNLIRNTGLARSVKWTEVDWTGQDCSALGWTEVVLARKKWTVVDVTNLVWTGMNWTEPVWTVLNWHELTDLIWPDVDWKGLNWTEVHRSGMARKYME
jgi:hypothetical protein